MRKALLFLAAILTVNCTPAKTVTISNDNTALNYNCSRFEPQAKSIDEVNAVRLKANEVMTRSREEENYSLFQSLRAARDVRDIQRLEELIVKDECSRQK